MIIFYITTKRNKKIINNRCHFITNNLYVKINQTKVNKRYIYKSAMYEKI